MCRAASPGWRAAIAWTALSELAPDDAVEVAALFMPALVRYHSIWTPF